MKSYAYILIFAAICIALFYRGKAVEKELKLEEVNFLTGFSLETSKEVSRIHGGKIPTSIIMAQAILESGWGTSRAARKYKALFGWKTGKGWKGKRGRNGDGECRAYDTWMQSYLDHAKSLMAYDRYDACFDISQRLTKKQRSHEWARCLQRSGYCPSHDYDDKLIKIINQFNLYQHD
jgi:flagellum-specific peptidoglycan hydrolase FlgJ